MQKYDIERELIYPIQLCCEELVFDYLNHCFPGGERVDIHLEVSYAQTDESVWIHISSGGRSYNPFEESDNVMAVSLIRQITQRITHQFVQERNQLTIVLMKGVIR